MELLKAIAMPFQIASLLFVAVTSLLLALVTGVGGAIAPLAILATFMIMVWLTQYAFTLIDDAANGVRETAAASAEMLSPLGDARFWIHPALIVGLGILLAIQPQVPRLPVLAAAGLLFPASIGAIAISGRVLDAFNPAALFNVVRGLAHYYVLAVLWSAGCIVLGLLVADSEVWSALRFAVLQLLLLSIYACIGGAIYVRRVELGFDPRVSPERALARDLQERDAERQHMIDGLYRDLRVRETARATGNMQQWLQKSATQLHGDVQAILTAGKAWTEPRTYPQLLRALVAQLLSMRQTALAFTVVEAGLAVTSSFAPANETDTVAMIQHALHSGRKRLAATLLANYLATLNGAEPGPELQSLRSKF